MTQDIDKNVEQKTSPVQNVFTYQRQPRVSSPLTPHITCLSEMYILYGMHLQPVSHTSCKSSLHRIFRLVSDKFQICPLFFLLFISRSFFSILIYPFFYSFLSRSPYCYLQDGGYGDEDDMPLNSSYYSGLMGSDGMPLHHSYSKDKGSVFAIFRNFQFSIFSLQHL